MLFFFVTNVLVLLIFSALFAGFCRVSDKNIRFWEKMTRNRYFGFFLSLAVLIRCIPYAEVVSPQFLLPLLWPLAVIVPVLAYFFIDFYAARALAGAMILYAYESVHAAYELKLPGAVIWTILSWIIGIAGIWLSAQPWLLRDLFRKAAKSRTGAVLPLLLCAAAIVTAAGLLISCIVRG